MSSFVLHYLIHKASLEVKEICSKKKTRKRSCVVRNGNTFFEKSFWALRWAVSNPASKIWPPATCRTGIRAHTHCFVCLLSPLAELLDYRGLPCSGFIGQERPRAAHFSIGAATEGHCWETVLTFLTMSVLYPGCSLSEILTLVLVAIFSCQFQQKCSSRQYIISDDFTNEIVTL